MAHVVATFATGGGVKIRYSKLSDGTQDFGTYTVDWCVMANV
jgi:hypothetical protein